MSVSGEMTRERFQRLSLSGSSQQGKSTTYNTSLRNQIVYEGFDLTLIRNCNESAPRKSYTQTHNKRQARSLPTAMASNLEAFSY